MPPLDLQQTFLSLLEEKIEAGEQRLDLEKFDPEFRFRVGQNLTEAVPADTGRVALEAFQGLEKTQMSDPASFAIFADDQNFLALVQHACQKDLVSHDQAVTILCRYLDPELAWNLVDALSIPGAPAPNIEEFRLEIFLNQFKNFPED